MQPQVDELLHRRWIEHGHHRRGELMIGLVRQRRGLGGMVVAGQHEHASVFRRSGEVGVLEHVTAAVDAGSFAVPHREDSVVFRVGVHVDLLAAPDRGGREVLVQAGLELDVCALEELRRSPKRQVEAAQGRASIAGNKTRGIEPRELVALALQHQQPHQCLHTGQVDAAGFELVFVVEGDFAQRGCAGRGGGHRACSKNRVSGLRGDR